VRGSSLPHPLSTRGLLAATLLLALACADRDRQAGGGSPETHELSGKLVITGSSTVAPLASEIARRFEQRNPRARIDVQTGGSSRGIADTRSGVADLGMASRSLSPDESDLEAHTLARDGVCLIVHTDNAIAGLSREQVAAIFTGTVENWAEVGGRPGPITVVTKAAGRATLEVFLDYFDLSEREIAADIVIGDNQQGLKTIAGSPGAIGYVSIGAADYAARNGAPIKLLAAGVVAATPGNVASGRFPITRPLNLLAPAGGSLSPLERAFLDFALSNEVHDLVTAQLFAPAGEAARTLGAAGG
jgi:phosphate transport system substrate-binding protein